jgi:hypothetical protein
MGTTTAIVHRCPKKTMDIRQAVVRRPPAVSSPMVIEECPLPSMEKVAEKLPLAARSPVSLLMDEDALMKSLLEASSPASIFMAEDAFEEPPLAASSPASILMSEDAFEELPLAASSPAGISVGEDVLEEPPLVASSLASNSMAEDAPQEPRLQPRAKARNTAARQLHSLRFRYKRSLKRSAIVRRNLKLCRDELCTLRKAYKKAVDWKNKLPADVVAFLEEQIAAGTVKKCGHRWTPRTKGFALGVYFKSPAAYKTAKQLLVLPSKSTLLKPLRHVLAEPGICPVIMEKLRQKLDNAGHLDRTAVLTFDAMSVRSEYVYREYQDQVVGMVDTGDPVQAGKDRKPANLLLVFMLRSIFRKWKQVNYVVICIM